MFKPFKPTPGKYKKISVYATDARTGEVKYLHTTTAYPTLRAALVGAVILFEHNKTSIAHDAEIASIDPFSIRAFYES